MPIRRPIKIIGARQLSAENKRNKSLIWANQERHKYIPKSKNLATKLGLNPKERIHFFAAFSGEWSKALAEQGLTVDTSDITFTQSRKLNKNKGELNNINNLPAELHNIIPEYYDWSISYEPIPIHGNLALEYTWRTGLLNKKGMKIIYSPTFKQSETSRYIARLKKFSELYGITFKEDFVILYSRNSKDTNVPVRYQIITITTTPEARRKADLDIFVERRITSSKINLIKLKLKHIIIIAKEFGKTEREIFESIKRIIILNNL